ncbi:crossover junction endonuclease [Physcia stellaris]|nr:crossover junction endonuclease [Physcia stellaris]
MARNSTNIVEESFTDRERPRFLTEGIAMVHEALDMPGREFLKRLIYPHPGDEVIKSMPVKVLETRGRIGTSVSSHEADKARYEFAWCLLRIMQSSFHHIHAVGRAFRAPGGFSVLSGLPKTGKTTVAVIQAWQAAMTGHKVLICGPTSEDVDAISNRLMELLRRSFAPFQLRNCTVPGLKKVYLANYIWEDEVFLEGLLAELTLIRKHTNVLNPSPEEALINRLGPHVLFHELAHRLEAERLSRTGLHNITQPPENSLYGNIPHLYDTLNVFSETSSEQSREILETAFNRIIQGLFAEADILVTSCLAAGYFRRFKPTMVIVDQWDTNKDWECMIPLAKFRSTQFRSMIGNFDLPHWQQMYEYKSPLALPVQFATLMTSMSPLNSVYILRHLISNNIAAPQRQNTPEEHHSTGKNNGDALSDITDSAPISRDPISTKAREEARQGNIDCDEKRSKSWDVGDDRSSILINFKRRFTDSDEDETESLNQTEYVGYYFSSPNATDPPGSPLNAAVTQGIDEFVADEAESSEQTEYSRRYFESADTASSLSSSLNAVVIQDTDVAANAEAGSPEQTKHVKHYHESADVADAPTGPSDVVVAQSTDEVANDEAESRGQPEYVRYSFEPADPDGSSSSTLDAAAAQGTSEVVNDEAESLGHVEYEYTETPNGGHRSRMQWAPSRRQALVPTTVKSYENLSLYLTVNIRWKMPQLTPTGVHIARGIAPESSSVDDENGEEDREDLIKPLAICALIIAQVKGSNNSSPTSQSINASSVVQIPPASHHASTNITEEPTMACYSKYGSTLREESCLDALRSISSDSRVRLFGQTGDATQIELPIRFLSVDGQCAIDVELFHRRMGDVEVSSWSAIREGARRIISRCVEKPPEGSRRRPGGIGGIHRHLGLNRWLSVFVRSYDPNVRCSEEIFFDPADHCATTLSKMPISAAIYTWLPRGAPPVGRSRVFVPKLYEDANDYCFATINLSFGDVEEASYLDLWRGAYAVYWMCIRRNCHGVSLNHGGSSIRVAEENV